MCLKDSFSRSDFDSDLDRKPLREENAKVQSSVSPLSANPFLCGSHATLQHAHQASPDFPPLGFHLQSVFSPRNPQPLCAPRRSHQSRPPAAEAPPPSGSKSPPLPPSPQQLRPTAPLIDTPARRKLRRRRTEPVELPSGPVEEFPADTAPRLRRSGEAFNSIVERTALFLLTGGDGGCGGGGTRKCGRRAGPGAGAARKAAGLSVPSRRQRGCGRAPGAVRAGRRRGGSQTLRWSRPGARPYRRSPSSLLSLLSAARPPPGYENRQRVPQRRRRSRQ